MGTPHERVQALRAFTGLTPTQFAERLGCTRQMAVYVERGDRRPGVDIIHALESLSLEPRADGLVWDGAPLSTEEWISTNIATAAESDTIREQTTPPTDEQLAELGLAPRQAS